MARQYTLADLAECPDDGQKYELIRAQLVVSPAPSMRHQIIVTRLAHRLAGYLEPLGLLDTFFAVAADISWDDKNLVQPDLLVTLPEAISGAWTTVKRLRLAVEVISPSSRRRDRLDRRTLYQEHNVEMYWTVDPDVQIVERWRPADARPELIRDRLVWRVHPEAPEMAIDIAQLFANLPVDREAS